MELSDIKREKDLHKLSFADLFYEIYDEPNGESIAMGIIRLIMPDFDDVYKEGRVEAAKYERFREHLSDARFERSMYSCVSGDGFPSWLLFLDQWINDHVMDIYGGSIERLFNEGSFENVCDALYKEFADAKNPEGEGKQRHFLIDAFVKDEKRYEDFRENLERKINDLATGALASSKIIKGLFLLPKLESDQELIIFFGNNFSATFNSVDAYTGLLYASEYFDFDGEILSSLTSDFSEEEIKAAEIAETSWVAKEREEKAKREEERKRSEQYSNAIKAFDNGCYGSAYKSFCELGDYREAKAKAAEAKERKRSEQYSNAIKAFDNGCYGSAYKSFCELGDYREAKAKAVEAKVKWDEKTRIDRMRSEASKYMQPIMVKGKNGSGEYRVPWRILDVDADLGRVLMITEVCIGDRPWGHGTWSECSLRKWLNEEFYSSLPEEARIRVATTTVRDIDADKIVEDRIFILSVDEVHKYFRDQRARRCSVAGEQNPTMWWMRNLSTGKIEDVRVVDKGGNASSYKLTAYDCFRGCYYDKRVDSPTREGNSSITAVRPALWIQTGLGDAAIAKRQSEESLVSAYAFAKETMYEGDYKKARDEFRKLGDFKDSKSLANLCSKGIFFAEATELMNNAKTEKDFRAAIAKFEKADDFYLSKEGSCSSLSALSSKTQCEKLARIAMLSEALIKLAGGKPSKPSSELYEERRAKSLEKEKQGMQQELSRLGFFKGKEKRLLLEKIEKKEAEIREAVLRAEKARKAANEQYNKARADYMQRVKSFIAMLKVGDEINLGSNGIWQGKPCPYTWRVQKIESDQVLIVLLHLLCTQYHDKEESVDWASCALRKKTIAEMLSDHFTKTEKSLLKKVSHDGVSDFIFAPSEQEINRYGLEIGRYGLTWLRGSTSDRGRAPIFDNGSVVTPVVTRDCTEIHFVTLLAWLDFS